VLNTGTWNLMK